MIPAGQRIRSALPLGGILLATGSIFRRYRWMVFATAVVLEVIIIWLAYLTDSTMHPLDPVGAGVVFIAVLAAGFGGALAGLAAALAGVVAAFALLADFGTVPATITAVVSAIIWCVAAVATGLVVSYLRRQVARRETALQQALGHSRQVQDRLERVIEFSPHFYQSEDPIEAAAAISDAAIETFGADGARLYALRDDSLELLAARPVSESLLPGFSLPLSDFPEIQEMITKHRPSFARDVRSIPTEGLALELRQELHVVSAIRVPITSPTEPMGLLSLGWNHPIEQPAEDLLAIMQRFGDQAAIAWQNALRAEAQSRVDKLYETLERVVALAPTFHITGPSEEVARAVCEAALSTFDCTGAALFRIGGGRLYALDHRPPLPALSPSQAFSIEPDMPLARNLLSRTPTFIPSISDANRTSLPWPAEAMCEDGICSLLYVPLNFEDRGPQNLLLLSWDHLREQPDPGFLVIVERFADQVALALSNASAERLHARLEASLLPSAPVDHPRFSVITRYRTGEQRLHLGGDFVGSTSAGDSGLHFVIGDVSGHGPDAAALGATLRSTWKALVLSGASIRETMDIMRRMLLAEKAASAVFATIIAGRVDADERTVSFVNAGHVPPLLLASGQVCTLEGTPAYPLGFDEGAGWAIHRFPLPERWTLFLYTDGLSDARVTPGSSQRYGEARLKDRLAEWASAAPDGAAIDALMAEIETAGGSRFADDVAVLVISTKDSGSAGA